ncbi:sirohydrochlorin cobaltochelatase [Harryflintia acetispora]|uniref:Sirohydrochlorin cobaltochelatase n=1 Tax=Harryflintia acetispora TaxID=1849041 RepID=A0A9X8Y8U2_9FIRM|nr:sirohydrochlorin cobaltochelatase [Harryflintia acetispora]TCL44473.1 sirohydrochlorin cobaltochelatase [Harryflintia acetispora]
MKKNVKKIAALILALSMSLLAMAGCSGTQADSSSESGAPEAGPAAGSEEESSSTAESSAAADKALLVVSFGTSYNDNRDLTIGGVENALQQAFPEYEVRRAFTSQIIIDKLKERDGLSIDNVTEAMDRLVADGVREVVVQPTHVMSGYEYDDVVAEVTPYQDKFDSLKVGRPLLDADADYDELAAAITAATKEYDAEGTAIVFMGHGTEHEANAAYAKLQEHISAAGHGNYFIGTVEATPSLDDVLALVKDSGAGKIVLLPLMIVAGDHANNDMAGDEEGSWKNVFEQEGFEVECVLKGLGQYESVQKMFVTHAKALIAK